MIRAMDGWRGSGGGGDDGHLRLPAAADRRRQTTAAYDPRKDPLVNPPSLFEPPPDGSCRKIATRRDACILQLDGSPTTLHPLFLSSSYEFTVSDVLVSPGLFTFDKEMKWRANEDMVESFEESPDHTTFTVKMKPGLKWQDGVPFTAHDVVYSWQQILDPRVPCQTAEAEHGADQGVRRPGRSHREVRSAGGRWRPRAGTSCFRSFRSTSSRKTRTQHPDLKTGDYYNKQARHPIGSGAVSDRRVEGERQDRRRAVGGLPRQEALFQAHRLPHHPGPQCHASCRSRKRTSTASSGSARSSSPGKRTTDIVPQGRLQGLGHRVGYSYIGYNMDGSNPFFADRQGAPRDDARAEHPADSRQGLLQPRHAVPGRSSTPTRGCSTRRSSRCPTIRQVARRCSTRPAGRSIPRTAGGTRRSTASGCGSSSRCCCPRARRPARRSPAIFQEDLKRLGVDLKTRDAGVGHLPREGAASTSSRRKPPRGARAPTRTRTGTSGGPRSTRPGGTTAATRTRGWTSCSCRGARSSTSRSAGRSTRRSTSSSTMTNPTPWIYNAPMLAAFNKRIRGVQFSPRGVFGFDPSFDGWWVPRGASRRVRVP